MLQSVTNLQGMCNTLCCLSTPCMMTMVVTHPTQHCYNGGCFTCHLLRASEAVPTLLIHTFRSIGGHQWSSAICSGCQLFLRSWGPRLPCCSGAVPRLSNTIDHSTQRSGRGCRPPECSVSFTACLGSLQQQDCCKEAGEACCLTVPTPSC